MKINSKLKIGTAKSRRIYLVVALVLCSLLASERASAQNATATLLNGGNPGITLPIGRGTFTFDINLTTTFSSVGLSYFLQSNDGSGFFAIIAQNTFGSPFDRGPFPPPIIPPAGDLNPVNDFDLGGTVVGNPLPPGSYFVATMTLEYSALLAPGVYHIFLDNRGIVADSDFNDHSIVANQFTVTIVPEPATAAMAVLGGVMLLAFGWRERGVGVAVIRTS